MIEKKITKAKLKKLEKRERNRKDKEWEVGVKSRDGYKCVICGETKLLNAHHILPRELTKFRWDIENGISLCPSHHQFSRIISAHSNSFVFYYWFMKNRFNQYQYIRTISEKEFSV